MVDLSLPIDKLRNVGPRNLLRLYRLGIKTVKDLLWHFPVRYDNYTETVQIAQVEPGQKVNVQGEVLKISSKRIFPRRMSITNAIVGDSSGAIKVVWFNQPYIENQLTEGTLVSLAGKASLNKHGLYLSSPTYEKITDYGLQITDSEPECNNSKFEIRNSKLNLKHTSGLVPVYSETEGVTSKYLRFLIKPLLEDIQANDSLPSSIRECHGFPELSKALTTIHYPTNLDEAEKAKERFAFEDLLLFQIKALLERRKINQLKSIPISFDRELIQKFIGQLPFELTTDQKVSLWEILKDLQKNYPMNRLMEGDVGSGKTVVALIAAYQIAKKGNQTVLMVPTEVLAQQHYNTVSLLIKDGSVKTCMLIGSEARLDGQPIAKKLLKEKIASGEVHIIIGTHAVIQKDVSFNNLAMVVIDEQHRFGINQRKALVSGTNAEPTLNNAEGDKLLYKDLSYIIRGLLFEVKKNLGLGHKESVYQNAFEEELKKNSVLYDKEKQIPIMYGDKKIGVYRPDFVIDKKIIVEFKSIPFLGSKEKKQLWTYLKGSDYHLALLVNWGGVELDIQRIIYDTSRISASVPRSFAYIPHLLSMTATPIPRTLALTIYGDLDISLIKEKPKNRQKIITKVTTPSRKNETYQFIREEVKNGRQVFVVCPRIELSDPKKEIKTGTKQSKMNILWQEVKAVEEEYRKLSTEIFPDLRVAMLHGKLKPKEKNEIMSSFAKASEDKDKRIDILVSTSVIEVGVDIPNATIMAIESAERFGLAQLHQFRGRVGRGEYQSYCILFSSTEDKSINQRLKALVECDDGFELAEKDMKIRGPGEFFGVKQSGMPDLGMASLANMDLIKKARAEARLLLKEDPSLKSYPLLCERLDSFQKLTHFE